MEGVCVSMPINMNSSESFSVSYFFLIPITWNIECIFTNLYNPQTQQNYSCPWSGQLQKLSIPVCEVKVYI